MPTSTQYPTLGCIRKIQFEQRVVHQRREEMLYMTWVALEFGPEYTALTVSWRMCSIYGGVCFPKLQKSSQEYMRLKE